MTRNSLLALLSLLLMTAITRPLLPAFVDAAETPANEVVQEPAQQEGEHDEATVIAQNMDVIKKGMRRLRRGLKDKEQLPAALPIVMAMQEAAQICKTERPAMTDGIEGKEAQDQFVTEYRLGMIQFQNGLLMLEEAVLKGDADLAQKIYGKLKDAQESGHEKFTEE